MGFIQMEDRLVTMASKAKIKYFSRNYSIYLSVFWRIITIRNEQICTDNNTWNNKANLSSTNVSFALIANHSHYCCCLN